MIAGVPPRLFITPPIKADGLFPEVCVNERFFYGDRQNPDTQLEALSDAEKAFSLYRTCNYSLPTNFSLGIEKISIVVGQEVDAWNVKRLKKNMERQLFGEPQEANRSALHQLSQHMLKLFS